MTVWFANECRDPITDMVLRVRDYWESKAGARPMPRKNDVDLLDLTDIAPNMLLADIRYDPFEVWYRMVGPTIVRYSRRDFTGEEAASLTTKVDAVEWRAVYRLMADSGRPVYGQSLMPTIENRDVYYAFAVFPLSDESGTIVQALGVEDYHNLTPVDRAFAEGEAMINPKKSR